MLARYDQCELPPSLFIFDKYVEDGSRSMNAYSFPGMAFHFVLKEVQPLNYVRLDVNPLHLGFFFSEWLKTEQERQDAQKAERRKARHRRRMIKHDKKDRRRSEKLEVKHITNLP